MTTKEQEKYVLCQDSGDPLAMQCGGSCNQWLHHSYFGPSKELF